MKVTINTRELIKALTLLWPAVPAASPKPVLQCVDIIGANAGKAVLHTTSLDLHVECTILAKAAYNGHILTPHNALFKACKLAKSAKSATICLSGDNEKAQVTWSGGKAELIAYDPVEFPVFPLEPTEVGKVGVEKLTTMLRGVAFAVTKAHSSYAISNISLCCKDGLLQTIATDGNMLAIMSTKAAMKDFSLLVSPDVGDCLRGLKGEATIYEEHEKKEDPTPFNRLMIACGSYRIAASCPQGRFPKYLDVIPKDAGLLATIDIETNELAYLVSEAAKGTGDPPIVHLTVMSGEVGVSSKGVSANLSTTTKRETDYPSFEIDFKAKSLAGCLAFIGMPARLAMSTTRKISPTKLTPISRSRAEQGFFSTNDIQKLCVLMPHDIG